MSKIDHLQNYFLFIFNEFTLQFFNKMHWIQLQYTVDKGKRILFLFCMFRKDADIVIMKAAIFILEVSNLDFLRANLAGLVLTLAVW